jgi:hypothetical protein
MEVNMRNLLVYPITIIEIEECLLRLSDEINAEERIGDMRPLLLREAAKIVVRADFVTSDARRVPIRKILRRKAKRPDIAARPPP